MRPSTRLDKIFRLGTHYLARQPISQQRCQQVLRSGAPLQCAATALAFMYRDSALFEVRFIWDEHLLPYA